jgi:C4-dicarboxylate-specific signal transduction histidine kinase
MGQLTASIALEVNQPIAAAATNAHAALRWLGAPRPDLDEARQALGRIVENSNRAGEVISRIRALIKKAPARKDGLAINDAILEVVALTHGEATKSQCLGAYGTRGELAAHRRRPSAAATGDPQQSGNARLTRPCKSVDSGN